MPLIYKIFLKRFYYSCNAGIGILKYFSTILKLNIQQKVTNKNKIIIFFQMLQT